MTDATTGRPAPWPAPEPPPGHGLLPGKVVVVTAAAGTALTMLDQQETIRSWWSVVPGYIDDVQRMLDQVESTVEDIEAKRESLRQIFSRHTAAEAEEAFADS